MKNSGKHPAFPVTAHVPYKKGAFREHIPGINVLDYFAAKAMNGELAAQGIGENWGHFTKLAARCYDIAEAMVIERYQRNANLDEDERDKAIKCAAELIPKHAPNPNDQGRPCLCVSCEWHRWYGHLLK
jgi:hypothetical protein